MNPKIIINKNIEFVYYTNNWSLFNTLLANISLTYT